VDLADLAVRAPPPEDSDRYGGGALAERLEARVAELLGCEAAAWLPSGTMAQQIALRIHADRRGRRNVGFHPHCHLDNHEERGFERLHDLHATLLGEAHRPLTAADVEAVREPLAALLLELPQRDLGGTLPSWEQLRAICALGRDGGAAVHLDGARLWQCGHFYGRPLAEIAGLFDSVYVSFYKDLGAGAGCALAGRQDLVDEARVWQVRHGGRLFSATPLLLAAERGLDEVLPRMPLYVEHTGALAAALAALPDVEVVPDPPPAAMFHAHVRRPLERLRAAAFDLAEEQNVWIGGTFGPTPVSSVQVAELTIGDPSLAVPPLEAQALWAELLDRAQ
jgi:threonine aldolase